MTQLTACEFMVKGYHYTKPTIPTRIDSCKLYIDTSIDGEESSVIIDGEESSIIFKYHVVSHVVDTSTNYAGTYDVDAYLEDYTIPNSGSTIYYLYNSDGTQAETVATNITGANAQTHQHDLYLQVYSDGTFYFRVGPGVSAFENGTGTFNLITSNTTSTTTVSLTNIWISPETANLDETETELLRLKGIHGFYFQN